jgi:hypothetical protein
MIVIVIHRRCHQVCLGCLALPGAVVPGKKNAIIGKEIRGIANRRLNQEYLSKKVSAYGDQYPSGLFPIPAPIQQPL